MRVRLVAFSVTKRCHDDPKPPYVHRRTLTPLRGPAERWARVRRARLTRYTSSGATHPAGRPHVGTRAMLTGRRNAVDPMVLIT